MRKNKQTKVDSLKTSQQFDEVLKARHKISTAYFMLHYRLEKLSIDESSLDRSMDNSVSGVSSISKLGLIIPKRWAKHAVTRSLIKRQCRAQFKHDASLLPLGNWVIRLRKEIDSKTWVSCASQELKDTVRADLQHLFENARKIPLVEMDHKGKLSSHLKVEIKR